MKKIILLCCLMAATHMLVFGQASLVSKNQFTARVTQLNALLEQNKPNDAKAVWEDVHKMMLDEFAAIKSKMKDAANANNTAEQKRLADIMQKQYTIYAGIIRVRDNMVTNKGTINTKLTQFSAGLL